MQCFSCRPICRTLTDATYLLDIIAAPDATDPVTLTQVVPAGGYKQFLNKNGLQGRGAFWKYIRVEASRTLSIRIHVLKADAFIQWIPVQA